MNELLNCAIGKCQETILKPQFSLTMMYTFNMRWYLQRNLIFGLHGFVEGCHAVPGAEVQVSASMFQGCDDLHHVVQMGCQGQGRLCGNRVDSHIYLSQESTQTSNISLLITRFNLYVLI